MADLFGSGNSNQALHVLKKGSQLLKYGRKGNPKLYSFKLSPDESSLTWLSSGKEKTLKLASVSRIVSGQRTAVFQKNLHPEKVHVSFSLIYNNGKRSLDLICKDKTEAEVWFVGLRALLDSGHSGRSKIDGWNDGGISFDDTKDLTSNRLSDNSIYSTEISSPESSLITSNLSSCSLDKSATLDKSDAPSMYAKGSSSDVFRVSISSAPSTSSHGSVQDDLDNLGDVYVWGEVICDNATRVGNDKYDTPFPCRTDILLPRPLECNIVFDVRYVACGVRHSALVTRQGEVFTWGEESGGRLGHGVGEDIVQPRLVESLTVTNTDFVACGEFHTCVVTTSGELYTWGDGTHNAGLLGHGSHVSHWIPKRVSGPLDGVQVSYVACGTWHTALITYSGQLFTFGDGTFGVLGHGNRESYPYPKEVESLMGLKTIAVACGVWHMTAIVEVNTQSNSISSPGKLFTWGDGDKYRLGHGDKEPRLKPTCVPSLIDHNFQKLACGHSLTVGLTTSGQVFTMGSTVYGQLGNPFADGKFPSLVEDKLSNESVEEITCGSYHVAVLTAKNDVYTWGKGGNGRLGHGDIEDRKTPTFVEALKDRHVKHITCGSNFSAAICRHKWVSGAEQPHCSSCRQAFGFTRKRHNCYNCGLVHCHSCSSRKALRAALSPNPAKPYRVCDSCYQKLGKAQEHSFVNNKRNNIPRLSAESRDKFEQVMVDVKSSKFAVPSNLDMIKRLDTKAAKYGKKTESLSIVRGTNDPSLHLKDLTLPSRTGYKSIAQSVSNSRAISPFLRKLSPPRSVPSISIPIDPSFSKHVDENLKKTNELLNQEVQKLCTQVESLRQRCEIQEFELQKSSKKAQEAFTFAAEESARSRAAKEVIKSLTAQLKDMAERLPSGVYETDDMKPVYSPNRTQPHVSNGETMFQHSAGNGSHIPSLSNGVYAARETVIISTESRSPHQNQRTNNVHGEENEDLMHQHSNGGTSISRTQSADGRELGASHSENDSSAIGAMETGNFQVEAEWIEQYEPGVYITLVALQDGTRDLKRVRFSRRRFREHQAENWWSTNREKVYEKYNVHPSDKTSSTSATQSARRSEEEILSSPQPR